MSKANMPSPVDLLDGDDLKHLLNHFKIATGLSVRCFDNQGRLLTMCTGGSATFCEVIQCGDEGCHRCRASACYGAEKAAELGEPYIYACHAGLIVCSVPLLFQGELCGSVVLGPVLLWEWDEEAFAELKSKTRGLLLSDAVIETAGEDLQEISCTNMQSAAQLLSVVLSSLIAGQIQLLSERKLVSDQQATIASLVQEKKLSERVMEDFERRVIRMSKYPIEKERELITCVQLKDNTGAKKILNELLGEIFFNFSGNTDALKSRMIELIAVLSRAAVDAGAPFDILSSSMSHFADKLEHTNSFEEMCHIVTKTLDEFLSVVYEFRKTSSASQYLSRAIKYIRENYVEDLTLDIVAKNTYVSSFYLSHLFRSDMNVTFSDYVLKVRMEMARKLLKDTNDKIQSVAEKVGFVDANYFTRQFKKLYGIGPKDFRNANY